MADRMSQDGRAKLAQGLRKLSNSGSGLSTHTRQGLRRHASNLLKIGDVQAASGVPKVGDAGGADSNAGPRVGAPLPPENPKGARVEYDHAGSVAAARSAIQRNPAAREKIIARLTENGIDAEGL